MEYRAPFLWSNRGKAHTFMNTNTINETTASRYEKVARQWRARYPRETGLEPESDCAAFQAWRRERYATLSPARRRPYDAALHHDQGKHHPECLT